MMLPLGFSYDLFSYFGIHKQVRGNMLDAYVTCESTSTLSKKLSMIILLFT